MADDPTFRWLVIALLFATGVQVGRTFFGANIKHRWSSVLVELSVAITMAGLLAEPPPSVFYPMLVVQAALLLASLILYARSPTEQQPSRGA